MSLKTLTITVLFVDTDYRPSGLHEYRWLNDEENKNIIGR